MAPKIDEGGQIWLKCITGDLIMMIRGKNNIFERVENIHADLAWNYPQVCLQSFWDYASPCVNCLDLKVWFFVISIALFKTVRFSYYSSANVFIIFHHHHHDNHEKLWCADSGWVSGTIWASLCLIVVFVTSHNNPPNFSSPGCSLKLFTQKASKRADFLEIDAKK